MCRKNAAMPAAATPSTAYVAMRRNQLRRWIDEHYDGSQTNFIDACAKRGHLINQGELSGLLKKKSFGDKKARSLELIAGMPERYLEGLFANNPAYPIGRDSVPSPENSVETPTSVTHFRRAKDDKWTAEAIEIMSRLNEAQRAACVVQLRSYEAAVGPPRDGQALPMAGKKEGAA